MRLPLVVAVLLLTAGCLTGPRPSGDPGATPALLHNATATSGLDHVVGAELQDPKAMETLVGAVSAADVDGDGWTDLFVGDAGPNTLYRNDGGTFTDVTETAGVAGPGHLTTKGVLFDVDGDGDRDLFTANFGRAGRLYRNDGGFRFTEVTRTSGVGNATWAYGAAAVDVEGDGDLDLSVVNYGPWEDRPPNQRANADNGQRDLLYLNDGTGRFREVALERGLDATRWSFSHAWADHDRDGDPDLYMNVDFGWDVLYENDGTGNFTDVTQNAGTLTDGNGMGAIWQDFDGDLDLDLFGTNIYLPDHGGVPQLRGNDLFVNEDGRFEDRAEELGIANGSWGWDSEWADFDHDGDLDAVQANGMHSAGPLDLYYDGSARLFEHRPNVPSERATIDNWYNQSKWIVLELREGLRYRPSASVAGYQHDRFWENTGGAFTDRALDVGLEGPADSRAYAGLDHDRDGDVDLVRTATRQTVSLWENRAVDRGLGHWLKLRLQSTASNPDAIGAIVTANATGEEPLRLMRHLDGGDGFMAQSSNVLHLGLAGHGSVDELVVHWPSGRTSRRTDVAADQVVEIVEPAS